MCMFRAILADTASASGDIVRRLIVVDVGEDKWSVAADLFARSSLLVVSWWRVLRVDSSAVVFAHGVHFGVAAALAALPPGESLPEVSICCDSGPRAQAIRQALGQGATHAYVDPTDICAHWLREGYCRFVPVTAQRQEQRPLTHSFCRPGA